MSVCISRWRRWSFHVGWARSLEWAEYGDGIETVTWIGRRTEDHDGITLRSLILGPALLTIGYLQP